VTLPIRVLVVDDSAFVRKVLRELLSASAEIEVVGIARDGLEALEKIAELKPDVMTLDLMMPNLDGLGVLQGLPFEGAPRVIVVSVSDSETELGAAALQAGAVDIVRKPTALATDQLYEVREELIRKVKQAAGARSQRFPQLVQRREGLTSDATRGVIVLGTSTGGPQAITRLLAALPGSLPVPVVIALHIPAGYTDALAARLDAGSALEVREAEDGMELRAGLVVLARGGAHVRIAGRAKPRIQVDERQGGLTHAPSVDVLFDSAASTFGSRTLGVVLTGMGDDGLLGSGAIVRAGGAVLTEAERSCVVYGMPRCVAEAGYSASQVSLDEMAGEILRFL
jgi:two-component system, chemotaxis family, protein-glutamate methylesterase/glutaminase